MNSGRGRTKFSNPNIQKPKASGWSGPKPFITTAMTESNDDRVEKKITYTEKKPIEIIPQQINCVEYIPNFLSNPTALYNKFLEEFNFEDRTVYLNHGKTYQLNRATCIFGDKDILDAPPKIWGADNPIVPWTPELTQIKEQIEIYTKMKYNICLCNYYKDGTKTIGWHNDKEEKGSVSSIASISLGYERLFQLKEINDETKIYDYVLGNGSLFWMRDPCQNIYLHWLPPDPKCQEGRINLTFRLFDKFRYDKS